MQVTLLWNPGFVWIFGLETKSVSGEAVDSESPILLRDRGRGLVEPVVNEEGGAQVRRRIARICAQGEGFLHPVRDGIFGNMFCSSHFCEAVIEVEIASERGP